MGAERFTAIERRLRALEDQVAIYQIVCGYGYAVDGLNGDAVGALYAPEGVYAIADTGTISGRKAIAAITALPAHLDLVRNGCAHMSTLPHVVIDGDRASATCHTLVVTKGEDGFFVLRLSASRLELSRDARDGWRIDQRQNYLLDGDPRGPELLARLNEPAPTGAVGS